MSDCGVKVSIVYEDERYPQLIIEGEHFTAGYWIDKDNGDLDRFCVCAARSSSECCCGVWDNDILGEVLGE